MNNRKSNPIVMAIVVISIILVYIISDVVVTKREAELEAKRIEAEEKEKAAREEAERKEAELAAAKKEKENTFIKDIDPNTLADALIIGDSRVVGMAAYGSISDATIFADVGMSIYNLKKAEVNVANIGTTNIDYLLSSKQFRKIYFMLGYNEIGYDTTQTVERVGEFVKELQQKQPKAVIFLQANLHITEAVSTDDENNTRLNVINEGIRQYADGEKVFYMDANKVFDDEHGNLNPEMTSDGVHLHAKYYVDWSEWIKEETKSLLKQDVVEEE